MPRQTLTAKSWNALLSSRRCAACLSGSLSRRRGLEMIQPWPCCVPSTRRSPRSCRAAFASPPLSLKTSSKVHLLGRLPPVHPRPSSRRRHRRRHRRHPRRRHRRHPRRRHRHRHRHRHRRRRACARPPPRRCNSKRTEGITSRRCARCACCRASSGGGDGAGCCTRAPSR